MHILYIFQVLTFVVSQNSVNNALQTTRDSRTPSQRHPIQLSGQTMEGMTVRDNNTIIQAEALSQDPFAWVMAAATAPPSFS